MHATSVLNVIASLLVALSEKGNCAEPSTTAPGGLGSLAPRCGGRYERCGNSPSN